MYGQNQPPMYANGAVVVMNQQVRPNAGSQLIRPMPPNAAAMRNSGAANAAGRVPNPASNPGGAAHYAAVPGRHECFLPVIQAQRPPYMQHPNAHKGNPPYLGVFGTRQVFVPQPPLAPPPGRGASAPRAMPRGYVPVRPPGSAAVGRQQGADASRNNASQSNGFTSERQSMSDSRSGTIVVPFNPNGSSYNVNDNANRTVGDAPEINSSSPLGLQANPSSNSFARVQPSSRRQHASLPQLSHLSSALSAASRGAAGSTYDIGTSGSGRITVNSVSDAGDIFTPIIDDSSDSTSSSSNVNDLISTSDSSPSAQYALSPELAANLNEYEDGEVHDYLPNVFFSGTRTCSKVLGIAGRPQNDGFDDEKNHYIITIGDHLAYRYEIQKELGRGTFGVVVRAYDHKEQREVAVKIIKNKPSYTKQAKEEVDVLYSLQRDDPNDEKNIVQLLHTLTFRNHFIIVFELLSIDLYNMVYKNGFRAMPMEFIYDFAEQMLTAMAFVRQHDIVHCDFKPENIVVCHQTSLASPGTNLKRLKLIDFGSACFENRRLHTYIQSRYYRAPEVVLGIPYTAAIDMWSFGCVVCELANGYPIFPGSSEGDLLQRIVEYLGHIPVDVQRRGKRSKTFYEDDGLQLRPKLSTMPSSAGVVPAKPHRFTGASSKSLANYLHAARGERDDLFLEFVTGCLALDPETRLTPAAALNHPWLEKWRRQRAARRARGR